VLGRTFTEPCAKLCAYGLHASVNVLDALNLSAGSFVSRVLCHDIVERGDDKFVALSRTHVRCGDATSVLRKFARLCALDVIHLWRAPEIVVRYLKTGDESLCKAAVAAVNRATYAAAEAANRAAYTAADAARAAACADAAAYAATYAAANATYAATYAAVNAANAVDAANAVTADAAAFAARAAYAAVRKSLRAKQERRLVRMLNKFFKEQGK
jgi:hypothetical protein